MSKMKKYKVVDHRNRYRNDPECEIKNDDDKAFMIEKKETDDQGNTTHRLIVLNPRKFQEERIVDEQEAIILKLKGVEVKEITDDAERGDV